MEILVERGVNRGDCVHKIVKKYGSYFSILREKTIPASFFGLVPEKVELEFCLPLPPQRPVRPPPPPDEPQTIPQTAGTAALLPSAGQRDDSTLDFVEAKKRVLAAAGKNPDHIFQQIQGEAERGDGAQSQNQQLILDKLQEIQEKIAAGGEQKKEHPNLARISQMLKNNDFSERYITALMEKARKELSMETLENFNATQDRFLTWIGESIKIYREPETENDDIISSHAGRIMVLIGPTGVGKTTTVAKLTAIYGIENAGSNRRRPLSMRMITIDAFRIGAKEQIEKYSEIMEIPISYIDNRRDLRREIDLYRHETDMILIDTIGRSPKDSAKLGEMKELLDACGSQAEIHLVLSASTKTSDMEHILRQFEPFDYQAVILTKLDETRHIGNVISALAEKDKAISFITDGQIVPKDIRKASVVRFLINLDEFRIDREAIEKQFPSGEADQFQWG